MLGNLLSYRHFFLEAVSWHPRRWKVKPTRFAKTIISWHFKVWGLLCERVEKDKRLGVVYLSPFWLDCYGWHKPVRVTIELVSKF